ncbi:putative bifunctional diguanylate cyclase/phosphodiesterase [Bowmanella dokdonensis]|uniref:Bifunctional diguanylate cyclase/phosphodiesterase n=1 Tax=Bowmanella dokdonensis TaxID=751969 RepID=A0A939DJD0_9ALTE|nr:bifunctional diguanylate cyclase/phosphodiesterase [Bowmanella dokdonensis]MBN7823599.1 bifunctional diguanylate cyclase/phosphodiesterase [Bowmanella dokdonensis]
MPLFVSLPWKILSLLVGGLLLATLILTKSWLDKLDQDFARQQELMLKKDTQQYQLLNDMLLGRMAARLESLIRYGETDMGSADKVAHLMEQELEHLQLHWQIGDLWLFGANGRLMYGSRPAPAGVIADVSRVAKTQTTLSEIRCQRGCEQFLSLPVLTSGESWVILSASSAMLELLAYLNQSTGAELALLGAESDLNHKAILFKELTLHPPLAASKQRRFRQVLAQLSPAMTLSRMLQEGARVQFEGSMLLLNLIVLQAEPAGPYLLLMHDITTIQQAHQAYQKRVILVATFIVVLLLAIFFWLTNSFRRRLVSLSRSLPLLAQKRYQEFYRMQSGSRPFLSDELEQLRQSAGNLAGELERLDSQVESHTSELERIALYDKLTGLPNRNRLNQVLEQSVDKLGQTGRILAVMFLDFDDFRKVNDSHGHSLGDAFLTEVAKELAGSIDTGDFLCRFGGDEFVLVLSPREDLREIVRIAESVQQRFFLPVKVKQFRFYVSVSIGIATTSDPASEPEELVRQADMAMYHAKDQGVRRPSLYTEQMHQHLLRRNLLEEEVRHALNRDQFCFALQPQIEILTGRLVGFEALLRWTHPEKGVIAPDEFIPLLENSENLLNIGYWGLRRVFELLVQLEEQGLTEVKLAVNLSAEQLLDPRLCSYLKELLGEYGPLANRLELELTERTLVKDIELCLQVMNDLRSLGFTFSIDDFGTGYSSLSYLKKIPVDVIKIDRSFVIGMLENAPDYQIVASTVAMVHNLGMQMVAEGVETRAQLDCLRELECEIGQGYHISRPILEKDLPSVLQRRLLQGIWQWPEN